MSRGMSLIELLIVVAIIGLLLTVAIPNFVAIQKRRNLQSAAEELRSVLQYTKSRAIARSVNCAVKFEKRNGAWFYSIYDDGDFDGVRNNDIKSGVDPLFRPARLVLQGFAPARIGLPPGKTKDPDNGLLLTGDSSPVHFNDSTLCSFSPIGAATAGSVYVTDGFENTDAVRVLGASGRIRIVRCRRVVDASER